MCLDTAGADAKVSATPLRVSFVVPRVRKSLCGLGQQLLEKHLFSYSPICNHSVTYLSYILEHIFFFVKIKRSELANLQHPLQQSIP